MKAIGNKYPGICSQCGRRIDAGKGLLFKPSLPPRVARASATRPIRWSLVLYCQVCAPKPQGAS
jgi:hypothetical protein